MGELLDSIRPVRDNKKLTDQELLEELQARGYLAHKPAPAVKPVEFDLGRLRGDRVRIGVISDTHFGSKFQQPSLLVEHLRYMKRRKVDVVMVGGDVTDGSTKMHPGFEYELWAHGSDAQVQAAADVLVPEAQRLKVPWFFIGGNHDFSHWKSAGVDVIAQLCRELAGRGERAGVYRPSEIRPASRPNMSSPYGVGLCVVVSAPEVDRTVVVGEQTPPCPYGQLS
jgi:hypothetical protein